MQTTKLHLIIAQPFYKLLGPQVKQQNYTDFACMPYQLELFIRERVTMYYMTNYYTTPDIVESLNNSRGPQVKLQNYTDFECMQYILKIYIGERVNRFYGTNY